VAHGHTKLDEADKQPIGAKLWPVFRLLGAAALVGLILLVIGVAFEGGQWKSRFFFAYLIGYIFVVGLSVGMVALVVLTHLFRAGWVVAVRRVPETFAANFWLVGLLGVPLLLAVFDSSAPLYPWSISQEGAEANFHHAEEVIHNHEHGTAHHEREDAGEHGGHEAHPQEADSAQADPEQSAQEVYVASQPTDSQALAEADGQSAPESEHAHAQISEGYIDAVSVRPGMAYPDKPEEAVALQEAYYQTLLSYMLDYKRFHGAMAGEELVPTAKGSYWYSPMLFALRLLIYFAILSLMGKFYWSRSVQQDETGDPDLSTRREWWAPPATVAFALTITFLSFDLIMSLDPAWYSTMFGVIFFANSFTAGIAGTILICMLLQKKGYLKTINTEHYHDLGKLLFAFVFFWGYVSFSQFMLIWYASLPETTYWFEIHGMTTVSTAPQYGSGWTYLSLLMLFGHLIVPFGFLLSRHVKRNRTALACASTWMLLMVYLDFYWYAMPFYKSPQVTFGLPEIGAILLLLSAVLAMFVRRYARHAPLAYGDPRLHETTALDTTVWAPIHH